MRSSLPLKKGAQYDAVLNHYPIPRPNKNLLFQARRLADTPVCTVSLDPPSSPSPRSNPKKSAISHYDALLGITLTPALLDLSISRRRNFHRRSSTYGGTDGGEPLLCTVVTGIGGLDVPHVRLENISPASNAHFGKVPNGILCLDVAYIKKTSR